jgi:hypothetical protein
MTFTVSATIKYLDGPLEGLTLADGFRTTYATRSAAFGCYRWLERVRLDADFIRATGTGNRYIVLSPARVDEVLR